MTWPISSPRRRGHHRCTTASRGSFGCAGALWSFMLTWAIALELAETRRDAGQVTGCWTASASPVTCMTWSFSGLCHGDVAAGRHAAEASDPVGRAVDALDASLNILQEMTEPLGFTPSLGLAGDLSQVPVEVAEQMLVALRAALSNAARHARASHVQIAIGAGSDLVSRTRRGHDRQHAAPPAWGCVPRAACRRCRPGRRAGRCSPTRCHTSRRPSRGCRTPATGRSRRRTTRCRR